MIDPKEATRDIPKKRLHVRRNVRVIIPQSFGCQIMTLYNVKSNNPTSLGCQIGYDFI